MLSLPARLARPLAAVAVVAATTAALGGCSIAGTDFHPGVAARVGHTTVTGDEVDRLATATCAAFGKQLAQDNQAVPMRYLKSSVLQAVALSGAVREFGAGYRVQPSDQYTSEVSATKANAGDLPAEQVEALVLLRTNNTLITDIVGQVGARIAQDDPQTTAGGDPPEPASDQAQQIGLTAFGGWLDDHEVQVDPQYDVDITAEGPKPKDTSVAFAVSELAKDAARTQPDLADTMKLPASQRCGRYLPTSAG